MNNASTLLNINEVFYILLYRDIPKKVIIEKIKNTLNESELKAVDVFIDWIKRRYFQENINNLFEDVNFYDEDLLNLSENILKWARKFFIEELIKMLSWILKWDFNIGLKNKMVSYIDGKIIYS